MTVAVKDESSFHQLFQSLPIEEKLIEEYSCSYNEGGSVSIGRLYISQYHVSYAPKIGSGQIVIPIKDISSISKKYSVYLFPNAIEIITLKEQKYFFSAFLSRDLAFATLTTIVNAGGGTKTKIFEDAIQAAEEQKNIQNNQNIKSSSEEIPGEIYEDMPEQLVGSQSRTSSTSSSDDASDRITTPLGGTPPNSSSPSTKMLNSRIINTDKTTPIKQQQQDNSTPTTPEDVDNVDKESTGTPPNNNNQQITPTSTTTTTDDTNTNNTTTLNQSTIKKNNNNSSFSAPVTPKKVEREGSVSQLPDSSTNNNNAPSRTNSSASLTSSTSSGTPIQQRKKTELPQIPSQSNLKNSSQSISSNSGFVPPASSSSSTTTVASVTTISSTTTTAAAASPSPSSVATVASGIGFASIPVREKCDHILTNDFEDQPWSTERFPISVEEFYNVVVRSDFWAQVNTTHGYTEQTVNEWKQGSCCIERTLDFRTAIAFKIGPKSTRVAQTQRCRMRNKDEMLFESSSVSRDVPYGESFSVENLMCVTANPDDPTSCTVKLSAKIKFTKTLWGIASMIQKSASQGNKEFFLLWLTMVRNQIEAYAFNKIKSQKTTPVVASSATAPVAEPLPIAQTPAASLPSPSFGGADKEHLDHSSSSKISTSSISLKTLWDNLQSDERTYIYIGLGVLALLFFGLVWNIMSSASNTSRLNHEIYKFSDSIVLLDTKLNTLMQGDTNNNNQIIITPTNMATDRVESLQRQLELATSLLQRTQGLLQSLQGELAIEALKTKKATELLDASGSSWFTYLFTTSLIIAPIMYFTGLLQTIKSKLPF